MTSEPTPEPTSEPRRWSALLGDLGFARWERWAVGLLFFVHVLISCQGLNETLLVGHQAWGGSLRSTIARHYDEVGFVETGLLPYVRYGPMESLEQGKVRWNHPPGINILTGISFRLFGHSEVSLRLVPLCFGLLSFWLIWVLARRRYGPEAALSVGLIYILLPMQIEYGAKFSNYDPGVLCMCLLAVLILEVYRDRSEQWQRSRRVVSIALLCLTLMGAGFIDWTGFLLAAFVGLDALLRKKRHPLVFLAIGVTTSLFAMWCVWWLTSQNSVDSLMGLGKTRSGVGGKIAWWSLFKRSCFRAIDYYRLVPLVLACSWIVYTAIKRRTIDVVVVIFGGMNLVYMLMFKQGTWIHNFYIIYMMPAVAMASGVGMAQLARSIEPRKAGMAIWSLLGVLFVADVALNMEWIHNYSYKVYRPKKPPKKWPNYSGIDKVILGKWLNENLAPDERFVIHPKIRQTMSMKYYAWRHNRVNRMLPSRPKPKEVFYVTHRKFAKQNHEKQWTSSYRTILLLDYLIYDLRTAPKTAKLAKPVKPPMGSKTSKITKNPKTPKTAPKMRVETWVAKKSSWTLWHWYWHSTIYPPYELVTDSKKNKKYIQMLRGVR